MTAVVPTKADLAAIASSRHAWRLSGMDNPGLGADDLAAYIELLHGLLHDSETERRRLRAAIERHRDTSGLVLDYRRNKALHATLDGAT